MVWLHRGILHGITMVRPRGNTAWPSMVNHGGPLYTIVRQRGNIMVMSLCLTVVQHLVVASDVKSSRPKWSRGQNFGLSLEVFASAWLRSRCLLM